jgi:hypothetical protein
MEDRGVALCEHRHLAVGAKKLSTEEWLCLSAAAVLADELCKVYKVAVRKPGFWGSVRQLFSAETRDVIAVDDVSFSIDQGEFVGYIGPNGAGKSTTVKMLAGILHPVGQVSWLSDHCLRASSLLVSDSDCLALGSLTTVAGPRASQGCCSKPLPDASSLFSPHGAPDRVCDIQFACPPKPGV